MEFDEWQRRLQIEWYRGFIMARLNVLRRAFLREALSHAQTIQLPADGSLLTIGWQMNWMYTAKAATGSSEAANLAAWLRSHAQTRESAADSESLAHNRLADELDVYGENRDREQRSCEPGGMALEDAQRKRSILTEKTPHRTEKKHFFRRKEKWQQQQKTRKPI